MTFNDSEYNALRTELIHHDRSCLTILQFLLTASTAIYGLVSTTKVDSSLLILLSIIWFTGFLYIVEKRSTIRRISCYIRTEIESKNKVIGWEEWCFKDRNEKFKTYLPKISPLQIELSLLTTANIVNILWLFLDYFNSKILNTCDNFLIDDSVLLVLLAGIITFMTSIICSWTIAYQYYESKSSFETSN